MASASTRFLLFLVLLAAVPSALAAQDVLINPIGTRTYGMGLAGVADDLDPNNVFLNPAVVASVRGIALSGNYQPDVIFEADDYYNINFLIAGGHDWNVGTAGVLGLGVGVTYSRIDFGNFIATNPQGLSLGEFSWTDWVLGFEAGLQYVHNGRLGFDVGFAVKSWKSDFDWASDDPQLDAFDAEATLYDFGALIWMPFVTDAGYVLKPLVGFSATNFGGELNYSDQTSDPPKQSRIGVGFRVDSPAAAAATAGTELSSSRWRLVFDIDYHQRDDQNGRERGDAINTGAEFSISDIVFFRMGYRAVNRKDIYRGDERVKQVTVGLGVGYDNGRYGFRVDYAYAPMWTDKTAEEAFNFLGAYFRVVL